MNSDIISEIEHSKSDNFQLGEYIYMGMGLTKGHRVCMSVAYKITIASKKQSSLKRLIMM